MSDSRDETEGVGAADPITGVAAGGDDLDADAQLPDEDDARTWDEIQAEANTVATNDAVAGETVLPGAGDGNDGPTGGAPTEITPDEPDVQLQDDGADLNPYNEDSY
jgi:hypothetical protein